MNSGVRLSVAIIVIIVIALGVYYASLGEDEGNGLAVIEPLPPVVIEELEPTPEPEADPAPVPVPLPITEPVIDPAPEVASDLGSTLEEELLDEPEPDPNDLPGDPEATMAVADTSSETVDVAGDAVDGGTPDLPGEGTEDGAGSTDVESGPDGMEPTDVEPLESAGTDAPSADSAEAASIDAPEGADSTPETIIAADRSQPGGPPMRPALAHRLALDGDLSSAVTDAARDSLGAASSTWSSSEPIPGLSGWRYPRISWSRRCSSRRSPPEARTRRSSSCSSGRISMRPSRSTAAWRPPISSLPGSDLSRIRFRIAPDAIDDVRESGRLTGRRSPGCSAAS